MPDFTICLQVLFNIHEMYLHLNFFYFKLKIELLKQTNSDNYKS